MSDYKIKLEDKAAFINRLDKQGIEVDSYKIIDNKLKGYFEFLTTDPITDSIVKTILKQSPKINKLKEMANLTKSQLAEIIREELAAMKGEKKEKKSPLNEINWDILGPALGVTLPGMAAAFAAIKSSLSAAKKQLQGQTNPKTGKPYTDEEIKAGVMRGLVDKMQEFGDN
jgi:hypothetical protein